jgi:hypothetical protein
MMNRSTRVICRARLALPARARIAAAIIATAVIALPVGACSASPGSQVAHLASTATHSSSPSNSLAASTHENGALAFARCMRSHGVPNFPDPNSSGGFPKATLRQLAASNPHYQAAQRACAHLLPNGGSGPTQAQLQQSWSDELKFARCMRSHGVSNWPDPTRYPQHPDRPYFNLSAAGIDPNSPHIMTKIHKCLYLLHGNNPQHLGGS